MIVREYSLKFVKLSRYATSLMSNRRDEMSRFLTGKTRDMEEEGWATMIPDNMDLSRLMVHVQQVEDNRKKRCVCDARKPKPFDKAGPTNGNRNNFNTREQPRFKMIHRVFRNLTFRGVQHLEKADPSPRRAMEEMCSIPQRILPRI